MRLSKYANVAISFKDWKSYWFNVDLMSPVVIPSILPIPIQIVKKKYRFKVLKFLSTWITKFRRRQLVGLEQKHRNLNDAEFSFFLWLVLTLKKKRK